MSSWKPFRWPDEWLDPKTLALLEGSPVNAIVVSSASHPIVAEAKKRKIGVIGLSKDNAVQELDASVPAIEPAQTATTESQIVALSTAEWPRIPTQWRKRTGERSPGSDAGPTGAPWVDSNGWKCLLAAAKAPGKTIWTLAEPPEDVTGYRPPHYALAVADSAVYGGQWVVAFDAETRKGLASGIANEYWKTVTGALRFFAEHKHWLEQPTQARLGILSDFSGPNQFLSDEALNLMMRRHLGYRIIDRARLKPESLRDLKAVLWIDQRAPEGSAKNTLSTFTENGGLLILPASAASLTTGTPRGSFESRFDYYPTGRGKVALATKPWSDPWLLAADTHLLLGRKYDLIRTFNAGSCNVRYTRGTNSGVVHVVSYTARPFGYPASIYVAHPYKSARWSTLSGINNEKLELKEKGEGVEVYLPEFAPYAAVEFGE